jgi:hypothetical protein
MSDVRIKVRVQVGPDIIEVERVVGNPNRYSSDPPSPELITEQATELFVKALPLAIGHDLKEARS